MKITKKNIEIERLRGISIILVFLVHAEYIKMYLPSFICNSFTGVDLFFVISGYVVTLSFLKTYENNKIKINFKEKKVIIRNFFIKRFFRLEPVGYIIILGQLFIVTIISFNKIIMSNPLLVSYLSTPIDVIETLIKFTLFTFNYSVDINLFENSKYVPMPHLWSLGMEWQFYLILPFILIMFSRERYFIFILIIFLIISAITFNIFHDIQYLENSRSRIVQIGFGVLLAVFQIKNIVPITIFQKGTYISSNYFRFIAVSLSMILIFCIATLPGIIDKKIAIDNSMILVYGVISAGLVYIAILEKDLIMPFPIISNILEFFGKISYSLYFTHISLINIYKLILSKYYLSIPFFAVKQDFIFAIIQISLISCPIIIISYILHIWVELRFIKLGRKNNYH